jgi:hypothetical protein
MVSALKDVELNRLIVFDKIVDRRIHSGSISASECSSDSPIPATGVRLLGVDSGNSMAD